MSLRLQNENVVCARKATKPSQGAQVKSTIRNEALVVSDENVENPPRKTSKDLKTCETAISDRNQIATTRPDNPSPPPNVEDIDADDSECFQFCHDYVKRIYDHLFEHEAQHPVKKDYLKQHPELLPKMRMCLIEWLISLQNRFSLLQDTFLLSISIMDRMLSKASIKVNRANFQLFGATCLWVASKYEEMYVPSVNDFVYMCAGAFTRLQFLEMEARILIELGFEFSKPLSCHFLRRFSKAGGGDSKTHVAAKYLIELSLFCYSLVDCLPSLIAAAALFVAGKATGKVAWDETMQFYSRYRAETLKPVALRMAKMALDAHKEKFLKTTLKKYSCEKFYSVPSLFTTDVLDDLFPIQKTARDPSH